MAENKLPEQQILMQFQAYQEQLQSILLQKENLRMQTLEMEKALEELEASKEKTAFKIVGPIMIKKTVDEIRTEMKERKESYELRVKTLNAAEERVSKKLKEMEDEIRKLVGK
ncbi:prefoldin subunit beta [Candidatus Micrarchaeota archaeon RBG_16_49_10]|nr:MAG: prefoldin subunit beta [Candidatus Micrarchaeota archaeon RBG_16_49_10]